MKKFHSLFFLITPIISLSLFCGCRQHAYRDPGPSLIHFAFDGTVENSGMLKVSVGGDRYVSYAAGVLDSCLDLSGSAQYRKPLIIDQGHQNFFTDYQGFSFMTWVKKSPDDLHAYTLAGQRMRSVEGAEKGWQLISTVTGAWKWVLQDGRSLLEYAPTSQRQPLDDGLWHQIGFTLDYRLREARFFYDGLNRAVYSLEGIDLTAVGTPLVVGCDPLAPDPPMETFNGMMDEVGVWSKALSDAEVAGLYRRITRRRLAAPPRAKDSLRVMTWNIWHGGRHQGRHVGVQRVADIIRRSGADIVTLQETYGSGAIIADALDFYLYLRSPNLSVLSRYPLGQSYNAFRPLNFGAVTVQLDEARDVVVCPVWLNPLPNTAAYVMGGNADADTIEIRERETRGTEMRFILSEMQPFVQNSDQTPLVLAGDFNSGSHLDWTRDNRERHKGLVVEFPASVALQEKGFTDSFRALFPDETTDTGFTWSPLFKETLADRVDYIYYKGASLVPHSARVIESHPLGFPSDHAAVVTLFSLEDR